MEAESTITTRAAGRRGGQTTAARYGGGQQREAGKAGGEAVREKYGAEHFRRLGQKGRRTPVDAA